MMRVTILLPLRLFLIMLLVIQTETAVFSSPYNIAAGDELSVYIAVRGSLIDLSKLSGNLPIQIVGDMVYAQHKVVVTPDGFISIPSLPPVKVEGLTSTEIESLLSSQLNLPVTSHFVTVALNRLNNEAFYVWGEVNHPGRFVFEHPITLMEAISYAGGPTNKAQLKQVLLSREDKRPLTVNISFKKLRAAEYPVLRIKPGDVIIIPSRKTLDSFTTFFLLAVIGTATGIYAALK